ncbi:hypothetical protein ACHAWC_007871 [Mediolabrus comicus]
MCTDPEKVFRFDLFTGKDSGKSTSYIIERYDANKGTWKEIDGEDKHNNDSRYNTRRCVAPGDYRLTIETGGDTCYEGYLKGDKEFGKTCGSGEYYVTLPDSQLQASDPVPPPTPPPSPRPTPRPTPQPTPQPVSTSSVEISGRMADCANDEHLFQMEIKLDKYGSETTWALMNAKGNVLMRNSRTYGANDYEKKEICLPEAAGYVLHLSDEFGDGICCNEGNGFYKAFVDGVKIFEGGKYIWKDGGKTHEHKRYGKSYVPLNWSGGLKESARQWANELLKSCGQGLYHEKQSKYGENLAANVGSGSWGAMKDADDIVKRFVEDEADKDWPANAHLTQCLWRASKYVGCYDAEKDMGDGKMCRVQVCRYARAGNCDMHNFNDSKRMDAVMQDSSNCGQECPPEGCGIF